MAKAVTPVLINRKGGTARADPKIRGKVEKALRAAGFEVEIEMLEASDIAKRCEALSRTSAETVMIGGGDGTISAAASALLGSNVALAVLPLGTLNHFARDLGIPLDLEKAAKALAKARRTKVDVAELNGRIFINNSAIGLYPLMVIDRESQQKRLGRSKRLAMLVASLRTLVRFKHHRLTLSVDGSKKRVDTPLLFVGNNDYHIDLGAAGKRDSLSDGRLCVFVMGANTRREFLGATLRALFNRASADDMLKLRDVTRLKVEGRKSALHVTLDGEVATLKPPLEYRVRPKALTVLAP